AGARRRVGTGVPEEEARYDREPRGRPAQDPGGGGRIGDLAARCGVGGGRGTAPRMAAAPGARAGDAAGDVGLRGPHTVSALGGDRRAGAAPARRGGRTRAQGASPGHRGGGPGPGGCARGAVAACPTRGPGGTGLSWSGAGAVGGRVVG